MQANARYRPQQSDSDDEVDKPLPQAWVPKIDVEPFDGNPVGSGPRKFLQKCEQLKKGKRIPEKIFIENWIPILLTGAALEWFQALPQIKSWDEFKLRLISKYQMPNSDEMILEKLYARKQRDGELA